MTECVISKFKSVDMNLFNADCISSLLVLFLSIPCVMLSIIPDLCIANWLVVVVMWGHDGEEMPQRAH